MNSIRKIVLDPSFWALIGINVLFVLEFRAQPTMYHTIIWLFWCQSIIIGLFTFLDMVTVRTWKKETVSVTDQKKSILQNKGCWPGFFVLHYGFFHLVYFIFLYADTPEGSIDFDYIKYGLIGLVISQLIFFTLLKIKYSHQPREIGSMLVTPYLRIIPMHLTILIPAFFNIQPALVFLILKAMLDVISHLVTTKYYWVEPIPPINNQHL